MYGDSDVPTGTGEECVEELEEEAELESGTWNAGTDRVGRSNSGVVACNTKLGLVVRRGLDEPGIHRIDINP